MNNTNLQQLHVLCLQMHQEGKTPSVGILRAKAPFKVSVTEAIEAIKRFNAQKPALDVPSEGNVSQQNPIPTTDKSVNLHARVEALEKEVAELKRALHQISNAQ
ncbi:hypothetical protein E5672_01835 [Alteromonas portus]|uniref:KfrA N-terminal DNA-binding domain-containing protein n=1 Tax=Alteromonas portus TaxID=2565549 RepID=A0A4U0ZJE8_9ALTE|nr:hypothetical protein [Alteromonas portus]TKB04857.1 hypothetical protein E5672_01835 [Alteromonas portus]